MKVKRIKDNITEKEFRFLLNYLKAKENIRPQRKDRLIKIFVLLFNTGLRINEVSQLTNRHIKELIENNKVKVVAHKQKIEKYIYITDKMKREIEKYFGDSEVLDNDDFIFTSERGSKRTPLVAPAMIRDVNTILREVFPNKNITSHSFRQTLITELAEKGINTKVIQTIIGHQSIASTYRYIKPSEESLFNSLESVR